MIKYGSLVVLFLLGIVAVVVYDFYPNYQAKNARQNWRKESAVVVENKVVSSVHNDGTYYNEISYQYFFSGREYISSRIAFGERVPLISEEVSTGDTVLCYVNPDNPEESVLFVDIIPTSLRFWGYGAMGLALILTFLLLIEAWRHKDTIPDLKTNNGIDLTPLSGRASARSGSFSLYEMKTDNNVCVIKPTIRYYSSSCIFIAIGFYFTWDEYRSSGMSSFFYAGLLGVLIGLFILSCAKKITFDGNTGLFSICSLLLLRCQEKIKYTDIQAIQLLHSYSSGSEGGGFSVFEMNLVLKDNSRVFVVGWPTPQEARENARTISSRMGNIAIMDYIEATLWVQ